MPYLNKPDQSLILAAALTFAWAFVSPAVVVPLRADGYRSYRRHAGIKITQVRDGRPKLIPIGQSNRRGVDLLYLWRANGVRCGYCFLTAMEC